MGDIMLTFGIDDSGQGITEYALIITVVAISIIALLLSYRGPLKTIFSGATQMLADAQDPSK